MSDVRAAIGRLASEIEVRKVEWLEPGYIARGKLCEFNGDPGVGKTSVTIDITSRITRGRGLFDDGSREPGNVILLSLEDDASDTIVPRAIEACADLERIRIVPGAINTEKGLHVITLPDDIPMLEEAIHADSAVALIIDPITACLSEKFDSHKDASIRKILAELKELAERTGCAIITIRHLNKQASNGKALYRGGGSIAFTAASRTSFLVDFDPTDKAPDSDRRRVLACIKSNVGPKPPSRAFRIRANEGSEIAGVEWIATASNLTSDDLLRPQAEDRRPQALEEAEAFLSDHLQDGPQLSTEITARAEELGISKSTLARARKKLGVRSAKKGFSGPWYESLPADEEEVANEQKTFQ